MGIKVQYSGKKAIHTAGVDVGPDFIHLDLDGAAVELPDDLAEGLLRDHPLAVKKATVAAPKAVKGSDKGDK